MPEFLTLLTPREALAHWISRLKFEIKTEDIDTYSAAGRINALPVYAPHPLPSFPRSTVDGFAVRAGDTFGAGDSQPAYLTLVGEVAMGRTAGFSLAPGECATIHTGGALPAGADAVIMIEQTQTAGGTIVEAFRPVAAGENVLQVGEDVLQGEQVIPAGTRLGPAEIGGLMALGITRLTVASSPRVGILSSGDEVLPPGETIQAGQVRDINSYSLSALVEQAGGVPVRYGIVPDDGELLLQAARKALVESDILVITAGSSASVRDLTAQVIDRLGKPGVLVHGVNIRPGKPTILAACTDQGGSQLKPVIGLPGNPVSALVIAYLFVVPVLNRTQGMKDPDARIVLPACLSLNMPSQAGREDWVPVRLVQSGDAFLAEPVFGKSNLIFTLARADGLARIPADSTGAEAGEQVSVYLFYHPPANCVSPK